QSLRLWLGNLWAELRFGEPDSDEAPCGESDTDEEFGDRFRTDLKQLRMALTVLALADRLRPAVLAELHRVVDRFEGEYRGLVERPELLDPEAPLAPGLTEWLDLVYLVNRVVPEEELQLWTEFGAALGAQRRRLGHEPAVASEIGLEESKPLPDVAAALIA